MRIIPAIDIINGKCVRLSQGNYAQMKTYNENPLEVAKAFEEKGFEYLHLVDLDGAKSSHIVNYKVLYKIATQTKLKIDFGGGIKENNDIQIAFDNGANQVTGGSISVKHPEVFIEWINLYGADKMIGVEQYFFELFFTLFPDALHGSFFLNITVLQVAETFKNSAEL